MKHLFEYNVLKIFHLARHTPLPESTSLSPRGYTRVKASKKVCESLEKDTNLKWILMLQFADFLSSGHWRYYSVVRKDIKKPEMAKGNCNGFSLSEEPGFNANDFANTSTQTPRARRQRDGVKEFSEALGLTSRAQWLAVNRSHSPVERLDWQDSPLIVNNEAAKTAMAEQLEKDEPKSFPKVKGLDARRSIIHWIFLYRMTTLRSYMRGRCANAGKSPAAGSSKAGSAVEIEKEGRLFLSGQSSSPSLFPQSPISGWSLFRATFPTTSFRCQNSLRFSRKRAQMRT